MAEGFTLHERLAADSVAVGEATLCAVRLMNDGRFRWLLLVPRRPGLREIHELAEPERRLLVEEIAAAARALQLETGAAKINVGALGNLVPQLHVHIVARSPGDAAWPGPVWGQGRAEPYEPGALAAWLTRLTRALGPLLAPRRPG
jgi:diadenosine tetraphosphate (Ap4A) HIT family hydrolase